MNSDQFGRSVSKIKITLFQFQINILQLLHRIQSLQFCKNYVLCNNRDQLSTDEVEITTRAANFAILTCFFGSVNLKQIEEPKLLLGVPGAYAPPENF